MHWIVLILLFSYSFHSSVYRSPASSPHIISKGQTTPIPAMPSQDSPSSDGLLSIPMTLDLRSQDKAKLVLYQVLGDYVLAPCCLESTQSDSSFFEPTPGSYRQLTIRDKRVYLQKLQYAMNIDNITLKHAIKAAPFYRSTPESLIYFPALRYWRPVAVRLARSHRQAHIYTCVDIIPLLGKSAVSHAAKAAEVESAETSSVLKDAADLFSESNAILAFYMTNTAGLTPILINIKDARVSRGLTIPRDMTTITCSSQSLSQGFLPYHESIDILQKLSLQQINGVLSNDDKLLGEIDLIKEYMANPLTKAFFQYFVKKLSLTFVPLDLLGMYSSKSACHRQLSQYKIENTCLLISCFFDKICMETLKHFKTEQYLHDVTVGPVFMSEIPDLFYIGPTDVETSITTTQAFERLKNINVSEISLLILISNLYSSDTFFAIKALQNFDRKTVINSLFFMFQRGTHCEITLNKFYSLLENICQHVTNQFLELSLHDVTLIKQEITDLISRPVITDKPSDRPQSIISTKPECMLEPSSHTIEEDTAFLVGIIARLEARPSLVTQAFRGIRSILRKDEP